MTPNHEETQAPQQSERIGVMATPTEKRAVRWVADTMNTTESEVMRTMTMQEIMGRFDEWRAKLGLDAAVA